MTSSAPASTGLTREFSRCNGVTGRKWTADVVGPICESRDFLAKDRKLPKAEQGDLLAVMSAGAYGFSMSSNYNSRPRAAEVLVAKDKFYLIRQREDYDDLIRGEAHSGFFEMIIGPQITQITQMDRQNVTKK